MSHERRPQTKLRMTCCGLSGVGRVEEASAAGAAGGGGGSRVYPAKDSSRVSRADVRIWLRSNPERVDQPTGTKSQNGMGLLVTRTSHFRLPGSENVSKNMEYVHVDHRCPVLLFSATALICARAQAVPQRPGESERDPHPSGRPDAGGPPAGMAGAGAYSQERGRGKDSRPGVWVWVCFRVANRQVLQQVRVRSRM